MDNMARIPKFQIAIGVRHLPKIKGGGNTVVEPNAEKVTALNCDVIQGHIAF